MFANKTLGIAAAGFALMIAVPASAQSVRSGIEAWQKGDYAAAVATWRPLADKGNADAAFNLGQAYRLGAGAAAEASRARSASEVACAIKPDFAACTFAKRQLAEMGAL